MNEVHTSALRARCEDEVVELHRFFEAWYRGEIDLEAEGVSRLSDVLSEGFHRISPDGTLVSRSEVLAGVRAAHASKSPGFRIHTGEVHFRIGSRRVGVVTYEEWHEEAGERLGRVSTAVFQDRADAPNGVEWVHVHETWLGRGDS